MLLTGAALLRTAAAQAAPAVCGALLSVSASASSRGRRLFAPAASASASSPHRSHQQHRTLMWSVEREKGHVYKNPDDIIDDKAITSALESTKGRAKDPQAIADILASARERAFLTNYTPGKSEYVEGLTLTEAATLLNVDVHNPQLTDQIFETARAIKNRIYGNRIVLFSPLYLSSWCANSCAYCAFRAGNKGLKRSALSDAELVAEVEALQRQGHRRLLVLTGEHPRYSFDQFLHALDVIASVKTEPCGGIRRLNVEIPSLSVSDMRRLKATDKVGTFTLFQESYHRPTFARMHVSGPKSDYNHRLLTQDRALRAGLDDVGVGALFGLADYRYEALGLLSHANHLESEYGAGPHTISIPRLRPADGSDLASAPPHPVDDAHFKALVAILRIAVPYTGMILSTRESAEMREALLQVGISQMSAGSRTDVGAYHRDGGGTKLTAEVLGGEKGVAGQFSSLSGGGNKGDKGDEGEKAVAGQFSLMDHRPASEVVKDLMKQGYVPSWCTACYRKGRTGHAFMSIAKSGNIHNFCQPNSLLTLQEYVQDYGDEEAKKLTREIVARESETLSDAAKRLLARKMKKVKGGEHDVYV